MEPLELKGQTKHGTPFLREFRGGELWNSTDERVKASFA